MAAWEWVWYWEGRVERPKMATVFVEGREGNVNSIFLI